VHRWSETPQFVQRSGDEPSGLEETAVGVVPGAAGLEILEVLAGLAQQLAGLSETTLLVLVVPSVGRRASSIGGRRAHGQLPAVMGEQRTGARSRQVPAQQQATTTLHPAAWRRNPPSGPFPRRTAT
jgi:hypothetical protein